MKFLDLFKGLTKAYYFRQLFFGALIAAVFVWLLYFNDHVSRDIRILLLAFILTVLYPYSRFAYESIVNFIMGDNILITNTVLFLGVKIFTMIVCWLCAVFIAPIGLLFIYFYQKKSND